MTVIAVSHNSAAVIGDMLDALPAALPAVIVDNISSDGTPDMIRTRRPDATVIESATNGGYGAGMNRAIAAVGTQFTLVISPDVSVQADTISILLKTAETFPDAALVAPKILNTDGSVEIGHDVALEDRDRMRHWGEFRSVPEGPVCAAFLSGAAYLARTDALRKIGGFDEAIFLYYEDDDLCRRLRDAGYSLLVEPAAVVTHIGGGSVPATTTYSRLKYWHMGWSRLYYATKHGGPEAARQEFRRTAPRLFLKSLLYRLTGRHAKARRDGARLTGMRAFLRGDPSSIMVPAGPDRPTC